MWTKRYLSLLLVALMALTLTACGAALKKDKNTAMNIQPVQLSEEEAGLMELLDIDPSAYRIFDFDVAGAQSIRLRAYELVNGEWECVTHGAQEAANGTGRIALTFGKMTEGGRMACKDSSGVFAQEFTMKADGTSGMAFATSVLTDMSSIELDQEIPLALQVATSKSEFSTYSVDYFGMPRELAKHDYEHVYAITVTFSTKAASELLDVPSAEPSPAN
ncbi:MAG: hypothetical protein K2M42_11890 [Oscillospiraceae bacterium]|nr:hypothetical protein [Oscillospiraceae bacterium]